MHKALPEISQQQIEKAILMEAVASTDAGISFLRWLCEISGWSRSTNSVEESARRDIWISIRRFVPIEKLTQIEYEDLKRSQQLTRELLNVELVTEEDTE